MAKECPICKTLYEGYYEEHTDGVTHRSYVRRARAHLAGGHDEYDHLRESADPTVHGYNCICHGPQHNRAGTPNENRLLDVPATCSAGPDGRCLNPAHVLPMGVTITNAPTPLEAGTKVHIQRELSALAGMVLGTASLLQDDLDDEQPLSTNGTQHAIDTLNKAGNGLLRLKDQV